MKLNEAEKLWKALFVWQKGDKIRVINSESRFKGRKGRISEVLGPDMFNIDMDNRTPYESWTLGMFFRRAELKRIK